VGKSQERRKKMHLALFLGVVALLIYLALMPPKSVPVSQLVPKDKEGVKLALILLVAVIVGGAVLCTLVLRSQAPSTVPLVL
jgi:hypothetical protein